MPAGTLPTELKALLLTHAAVTLVLVGLIWTIQIVHYPLFREVGVDAFPAYEQAHMSAITLLVGPLMLAELVTGVLLLGALPSAPQPWIGLALIGVIWLATMFINVPQHSQLAGGFDAAVHSALVTTNWLRTLAWTARGALMIWLLAGALR